MARPGEQVEAVVVRGPRHRDQGLRGRDRVAVVGPVPGRRHPGDRRRPAGLRLRRHLRRRGAGRDAGRGPRQRRLRHARRVPRPGRARRRGRGRARPVSRRRSWPFPTDDKVDAGPRARAGGAGRRPPHLGHRVGRVRRRRWPRAPSSPPPASARRARDRLLRGRPTPWPTEGDETQTGFGFSVGREPGELDVGARRGRRRRAGHPPARRRQAAERAAHRRARPVGHRPVPRHPRPSRSTARPC